jgi:hypothetical protein
MLSYIYQLKMEEKMKNALLIAMLITLLSGCASLPKNNGDKVHRVSGEKPIWVQEDNSPVADIDRERYFFVTAKGENLEYLQRVTLDAKATEEALKFYGDEKIELHQMVMVKSYWEQYETINQEGAYEYYYKVWGLYSIPITSP